MVQRRAIVLTESEKSNIRGLYGIDSQKRDYIFEACMSVDGRYLVFRDDVFDLQEQRLVGNLWSSVDTFKSIFQNVQLEDEGYNQVKESFLSMPIMESKQNLHGLRDTLLEFDFFDDTWLGAELKKSGNSIVDTAKESWSGLKEFGVAISQGEWTEILSMLAKGVRFVLRKLKAALYSNVGMVVDAIMIATGVGAGAVKIAWAMVLALDIYQFTTGDYTDEEKDNPTWAKLLEIGVDALGFFFASAAAKAAKAGIRPISKLALGSPKMTQYLAKNPAVVKSLTMMQNIISKITSALKSTQTQIAPKFPKGAAFIGNTTGKAGGALSQMAAVIGKMLGPVNKAVVKATGGATKTGKGIRAGGTTMGISYGAEKYSGTKGGDDKLYDALKNYDVKADYSGLDL
jgi:hypothetical protein